MFICKFFLIFFLMYKLQISCEQPTEIACYTLKRTV